MECNCNAAMQVNSTRSKDREMLVRLVNWSLLSQEVQVWSWSCWKTHNSTFMVWINRWTFSWKPKKCGDPGFPSFLWLLLDHISQLQHDIREPCLAATPLKVWRLYAQLTLVFSTCTSCYLWHHGGLSLLVPFSALCWQSTQSTWIITPSGVMKLPTPVPSKNTSYFKCWTFLKSSCSSNPMTNCLSPQFTDCNLDP